MAENSRKDRILELIVKKLFASLRKNEAVELEQLISHQEKDRSKWESLNTRKKLIAFINEGNVKLPEVDLDAAMEKFIKEIKDRKK